ncbi:DNA methylase [Bryobacterales bacterium F-183]|nr:DNA methylase [Bryobacterales bacterium F-183]
MRLGVIADIHGNASALRAVLAKLKDLGCDRIVDLGDCLSGPLDADETADILLEHNFLTVRGNHDRQLIDQHPEAMGPSDLAARSLLHDKHLDWLHTLPFHAQFDDVYLCHATPRKDSQYLLETVIPISGEVRLASQGEMRARLGPLPDGVTLVLHGHTHIPRLVSIDGRLLVNPGSVGLPAYDATSTATHFMETASPHARFAVLDRVQGQWRAEFHAIEYDWDKAAALATSRKRDDWAHALATGFALRHA